MNLYLQFVFATHIFVINKNVGSKFQQDVCPNMNARSTCICDGFYGPCW